MKDIFSLFRNPSYKKFVNIYVVVSALLFFGVAIELGLSYFTEIHKAHKEADKLVKVLEFQIGNSFRKMDFAMKDVVKVLKQRPSLNNWSDEEIRNAISERSLNIPESRNFFVVDANGDYRMGLNNVKKVSLIDRDYYYKHRLSASDDLYFSKPITSKQYGDLVMVMSRKILNAKGEFMGVIAISIPLKYFSEFYAGLDLEKDAAIILNSDENILYSRYPWPKGFVGKSLANQDIVKKLFKENQVVDYSEKLSPIDGVNRLVSSRKVNGFGFFVAVALSKDEYLKGWVTKFIIYVLGFSILSIFAFIYLANFLRSLYQLDEQRKVAVQTTKLTALGEMAGGVAHEINNPLTIISVRCEQLLKQIEQNQYDPESFKSTLEKINQTTERIAKIVKGLKTFSRNSEKDPFVLTPLKDVIENSIEICKEKFRTGKVEIKIDSIPNIKIYCRESQIVQVILNLLSNAYDAVEVLEEKWVHISVSLENDSLLIMITDSGKGIPEDVAENIMRPFFTTKVVGKGTGLGLSISKEIVRDHRGVLYLDKDSERTCFVIELPVNVQTPTNQ